MSTYYSHRRRRSIPLDRREPTIRSGPVPDKREWIDGHIVFAWELDELLDDAAANLTSAQLISAISGWLRRRAATPRCNAPICLTCSAEFADGVDDPIAFAIALMKDGTALTTGVCANCTDRHGDGLLRVAIREWRENLWPDLIDLGPPPETAH